MTKDEALKLALEAMTYADACLKKQLTMKYKHEYAQDLLLEAGTAIKEALAQPEQDGECKYCTDGCPACDARKLPEQDVGITRYADISVGKIIHNSPPPQRTWVGLTDEEIRLQWSAFWEAECHPWAIDFARAIEAKLREKNR